LLAGLNAALMSQEKAPWTPRRDEAYLGVLVDDLITMGTREPYRMFTSRAEYRLLLREDNADLRLTGKGRELGLVDDERWAAYNDKREGMAREQARLSATWVRPGTAAADSINALVDKPLPHEYNLLDLLKRPEIDYHALIGAMGLEPEAPPVVEQMEILAKYAGYIDRQEAEIARLRAAEHQRLPADFDFGQVQGLSNEVKQKLAEVRPETIGQAGRIPGVTPAAISLLLIYLKKHQHRAARQA